MVSSSFMLKVLRVGEPQPGERINRPGKAVRYWNSVIKRQDWFDQDKEHFVVLTLDTRCHVTGYSLVSIGTLNASFASPREVFRAAITAGACGIITVHNHPSGDVNPSKSDRAVFANLNDAGELLDIRVFDHVIVGKNGAGYHSFREERDAVEAKQIRARRMRRRRARRKLKTA